MGASHYSVFMKSSPFWCCLGYQIKQDKMEVSSQEWHREHPESRLRVSESKRRGRVVIGLPIMQYWI